MKTTRKRREIERIEAIIGQYVFYLKGTGEVEGRLRDDLRGRCAREIRAYMMRRARARRIGSPDVRTLEEIEIDTIKEALRRNGGNISRSARELGLHRRTLQRKIRRLSRSRSVREEISAALSPAFVGALLSSED